MRMRRRRDGRSRKESQDGQPGRFPGPREGEVALGHNRTGLPRTRRGPAQSREPSDPESRGASTSNLGSAFSSPALSLHCPTCQRCNHGGQSAFLGHRPVLYPASVAAAIPSQSQSQSQSQQQQQQQHQRQYGRCCGCNDQRHRQPHHLHHIVSSIHAAPPHLPLESWSSPGRVLLLSIDHRTSHLYPTIASLRIASDCIG